MYCRQMLALSLLVSLLVATTAAWAQPAAQTRPWRIGVAGSYCNGHWGMLGKYGLPRERLDERKAADPEYLKQFQVVILASPLQGAAAMSAAIEQFVAQGGIAITELAVAPSEAALPGKRISQGKGPNVRYVPGEGPLYAGFAEARTISQSRRPAYSIVPPSDRPETYVLARFTDEGAHDDTKGVFLDGNQGSPAMILFRHGQGWWLHVGSMMGFSQALSGPLFTPAIMNSLRLCSNGELVPRWSLESIEPPELLTSRKDPEITTRKRPGREELAAPPEGYEVWDDDPQQAGDFDLEGTISHGAEAEVVASYWNADWYRAVRFDGAAVSVVRVEKGRETSVATAPLTDLAEGDHTVHVRRRHGLVLVRVDGTPRLTACDGPEQEGIVASRGIADGTCQPAIAVEFSDGFMRTADEESDWEAPLGTWAVQQDKGDREAGEVSQSANPFRYEATAGDDGDAIAVVGSWFWDDYAAEASVCPTADWVGMVCDYQDPDNYIEYRVPVAKQPGGMPVPLLIVHKDGETSAIAAGRGECIWDQWAKIGVRISGGYVQGLIDGKTVVEGIDESRGTGQVGLLVGAGTALFDDVVVTPWEAMPRTCQGDGAASCWLVDRGVCESSAEQPGAVSVKGNSAARVLSPWVGKYAYRCWGQVRPGNAPQAGLFFRYQGPRSYYLVNLVPEGDGQTKLQLLRPTLDNGDIVVAETLLPGGAAVERHIEVRGVDEHIQVAVDGHMHFDLMDEGPRWGRVGMFVDGEAAATFRGLGAMPVEPELHLVDDLTPSFAGIIDRHSWAGKANFLVADPDDLLLHWHRGEFMGDVVAKVGVREQHGAPDTVVSLFVGDGQDPAAGYEVRLNRTWGQTETPLEILRQGQKVAEGVTRISAVRSAFEAEVARMGAALVLRVDGAAVLTYQDPEPLDVRRVGIKLTGSQLSPDDTRIETTHVRVYTFDTAATDWVTECGTWAVSSRWSCSPGWTWFSGWDQKEAWTTNKEFFSGDQRVDMFVGAKMVDIPGENRKQEVLRDIYMGLCTTPGDIQSGYRFLFGARENKWTAILKNGQVVAETQFAVPQGGLHNDWTTVSAAKHGSVVSLYWEGHEILQYEDPEPIAGGHVAMGTFNNGLLIPKVTIYGNPGAPPAADEVAPEPPPAPPVVAEPAETATDEATQPEDKQEG